MRGVRACVVKTTITQPLKSEPPRNQFVVNPTNQCSVSDDCGVFVCMKALAIYFDDNWEWWEETGNCRAFIVRTLLDGNLPNPGMNLRDQSKKLKSFNLQ